VIQEERMQSNDVLAELAGVKKRFGKIQALDGVDLQLRSGELFSVLGPNGAGKSTAISLLLGLSRPDAGTARLFGESPEHIGARRHIGVMMQDVSLAPELRVHEQIALVASYYPHPLTPAEAMRLTGTTELAARPYGKLSGGQKRQVQFAMAVCGRPKLLFLDEPSVGLDVQARHTMWSALRELVRHGASIVLTTHYLEEAEALSNRVAVLNRGRIIASGTVSEIRALVVRKHVTCLTALPAEQIAAWPDVESVTHDAQRLQISTNNSEAVVRRLLAADSSLQELEVRRAVLAEAFTELTQEAA
jgi:ABC-2 type transport system ATP-binding protein